MPTYDYVCRKCGHGWELFQSMKDKPVRKCPACGSRSAERLIGTGAGIIFRGSGFYVTDYRSKSYKERQKAEKQAAKGGSDSQPSGSDKSTPKRSDK